MQRGRRDAVADTRREKAAGLFRREAQIRGLVHDGPPLHLQPRQRQSGHGSRREHQMQPGGRVADQCVEQLLGGRAREQVKIVDEQIHRPLRVQQQVRDIGDEARTAHVGRALLEHHQRLARGIETGRGERGGEPRHERALLAIGIVEREPRRRAAFGRQRGMPLCEERRLAETGRRREDVERAVLGAAQGG